MNSDQQASEMVQDLGRSAVRGAAVTLIGQALRVGLQTASVVVLARLVSQEDYGLLAIVLVVVGIGEVFRDFGLSNAAIQAPALSNQQRDNLFWINGAIGIVLMGIIFALATPIAAIFEQRSLIMMVQVTSVIFVLNGFATQYRASLNRSMKFRALACVEVVPQAFGLVVAVLAAANGAGYWALVAQQLTVALTGLIMAAILAGWLPKRPRRGTGMRGFVRFGWNLAGTQLIGYASNNVDTLIIGLRFTPADLGLYNRAFQLLMNPLNQLRAPMTTVALPVFSRLQHDYVRSGRYMRLGQITLGYTVVAGLAVGIGASQSVVELFLGNRWMAMVPLFALMAVAGILQTLSFVGYWIYVSRGLTAQLFRYSLVSAAIKVTCVVVGSCWGLIGVALGYALAPALAWPLSLWWLSRQTPIPLRDLWLGALRVLSLAMLAAGCSFAVQETLNGLAPVLILVIAFAGVALMYCLSAVVVPAVRRDLIAVAAIARKVVRR